MARSQSDRHPGPPKADLGTSSFEVCAAPRPASRSPLPCHPDRSGGILGAHSHSLPAVAVPPSLASAPICQPDRSGGTSTGRAEHHTHRPTRLHLRGPATRRRPAEGPPPADRAGSPRPPAPSVIPTEARRRRAQRRNLVSGLPPPLPPSERPRPAPRPYRPYTPRTHRRPTEATRTPLPALRRQGTHRPRAERRTLSCGNPLAFRGPAPHHEGGGGRREPGQWRSVDIGTPFLVSSANSPTGMRRDAGGLFP